ncbi:NUDIX hydrolase [Chondromyces crocatus]|uniref:NUDIX hydrolase n=1 Tax=Chondromyces crocatus TaxID=52 RepID=UPI001FDFA7B6|nr:CoA pyrophosphatase [Chondromyces crocatus]
MTRRIGGRAIDLDSPSTERQAAVAAILRPSSAPGEDAEVLLVRRAERIGDPWSGHMAMPGGRREPADESLFATAVRETREEIGLDLAEHGVLLVRLPDVPAMARGLRVGMVIAPFVFALHSDAALNLNEELVEALWTPIGPLARGELDGTTPYLHEGQPLELPCYRVGDHIVWGLTHRMLTYLVEALHRNDS